MASKTEDAAQLEGQELTDEAVAAFLRRHPQFLVERPELLAILAQPERRLGDGVIDMQSFIVERLKRTLARARSRECKLLAAGKDNLASQGRVQTSVLEILGARSFAHLIEIINKTLPDLLDLKAVSLCVETEEPLPGTHPAGVVVLAPGAIEDLMGAGDDIVLRANKPGERAVFGGSASAVRSVALLRLAFGPKTPAGILALGSGEPEAFHPGQGTELLAFLARVVEHCIRRWLSLPA